MYRIQHLKEGGTFVELWAWRGTGLTFNIFSMVRLRVVKYGRWQRIYITATHIHHCMSLAAAPGHHLMNVLAVGAKVSGRLLLSGHDQNSRVAE